MTGLTDPRFVRNLSPRWLACALCGIALLASGCGSNPPESIAFAEAAPSVSEPASGSFSPAQQELIEFHASWLCEMQRRTFASLDDGDVARMEALVAAGIDPSGYETFVAGELVQQDVRDAVLWSYQQRCRDE